MCWQDRHKHEHSFLIFLFLLKWRILEEKGSSNSLQLLPQSPDKQLTKYNPSTPPNWRNLLRLNPSCRGFWIGPIFLNHFHPWNSFRTLHPSYNLSPCLYSTLASAGNQFSTVSPGKYNPHNSLSAMPGLGNFGARHASRPTATPSPNSRTTDCVGMGKRWM